MASGVVEAWDDDETRALCETRIKYNYMFTGGNGNSKKGWNKVIETLAKRGITRTSRDKFKKKWGTQVALYKKMKEPSKFTTGQGTEDGNKETPASWELFELFDEFHTGKHTLHPDTIADTSAAAAPADPNAATSKSYFLLDPNQTVSETSTSETDAQPVAPNQTESETSIAPSIPITSPNPGLPLASVVNENSTKVLILRPVQNLSSAAPSLPKVPIPSNSGNPSVPVPQPSTSNAAGSVPVTCKEFFNKSEKKTKAKEAKKKEDGFESWFQNFMVNSEEQRQNEHNQLLDLLKNFSK
ncbi:uncharacterized protein LOC113209122 [Frankliniella occidentalis]|uniref:Uncharacterized protein LOC113209122 n=1 Tax=Frankliniella occidentalis TaxID=133901 RepID=A0A6J1SSG8_FRAOC|nr:uncharacterized protein LOC113209122 [Frankliniella occidentalis]